ncbi:MAG: small subunit ribosomal protein [Candidatus Diapherotrites archaeon]|nr:small subunit ribosomal protein [Candidatus Diapherotrites archaeon]
MARKKKQVINTKAKKKRAVARAAIHYPGSGTLRINGYTLDAYTQNKYIRMIIEEPLVLAGDLAGKVDIYVNVEGGGFMGQAVAIRGAIAKGLAQINEDLRDVYMQYDRTLLVDDVRRVEPKKPLGRKARAKKQTSYR